MHKRLLSLIGFLLFISIVCYVCAFQIIDFDVWWHIAAGRIIMSTGSLISIDPFSYVREGMPYLASHEWLSQILLSIIYDVFGENGMIVFRTFLVSLALLPIILVKIRRAYFISPFAAYGAIAIRPAILDRPQLFSFVLFSFSLLLALYWFNGRLKTRNYFLLAIVIQFFWVNFHGGAAILHLVIVGSLFIQVVFQSLQSGISIWNIWHNSLVKWVALLLAALFLTLFLSPNTIHNFSYLKSLFADKSIDFIHEWSPRDLSLYVNWIIPCWILSIGSLLIFRKSYLLCVLLLAIFGFLSLQAIRHEPFFVFTALIISFYQIFGSLKIDSIFSRIEKLIWPFALYIIVSFAFIFYLAFLDKSINSIRLGRDGYGSYEPLRFAYNYLERENIHGLMFNNYEAGGYLLFRGYPDRKVFVDGRNIDYGYSFLKDLFSAGYDASTLKALERKYGFTYAVIQFEQFIELDKLPYILLFESFPNWSLVYIDDASAVYVNKFAHSNTVSDFSYSVLTPDIVLFPTRILHMLPSKYLLLETEINYALRQNPDVPNFRLRLAQAALLFAKKDTELSENILSDLIKEEPYRFEPINLLAMIKNYQGFYQEAGLLFEEAIRLGGGEDFISMDYEFLSSLFEKAGDERKAEYYKMKLK